MIGIQERTTSFVSPSARPAARPGRTDAKHRSPDTGSADPIRVLVADDHAVVRSGMRQFLEQVPDIEVVGEAFDGSMAVAEARRLRPDVVLMDLIMPGVDGIAATQRIKQEHPEIEVVVVTSSADVESATAALEAGGSGSLLKDAEPDEIATAVRAARVGEVHLDAAVARMLTQRMRERRSRPDEPVEPLTDREREVLVLVARGMSNKEIAAELSISDPTTRTHVSRILAKLGLASRTQAALWAVQHGMAAAEA